MALAIEPLEDPPEHQQEDGPEDEAIYAAIREHFGSQLDGLDEDVIIRFVRGYAHEDARLEETTSRLQFYLDRSNEWGFDRLLDTPFAKFDDCAREWELFIYGQNKFGHPIIWDRLGSANVANVREVFLSGDEEENVNTMGNYLFRIQLLLCKFKKALRMKYGKMLYKHDLVFDLGGFTSSHFSDSDVRACVKAVIGEQQHLFPEVINKIYLVNAPFVFRAAWAIISYFVDPMTYKKIKVLGTGFMSEMSNEIDLSQIPPIMGGTGQWPIRYGGAHTDLIADTFGTSKSGDAQAGDTESKQPENLAVDDGGEDDEELREMSNSDNAGGRVEATSAV